MKKHIPAFLIVFSAGWASYAQAPSVQWDKRFGGTNQDYGSVRQAADGGFYVSGRTNSDAGGDKTQSSWGGFDYWVVRTNSVGLKQWDRRFGGTSNEVGAAVPTSDGGCIFKGTSVSRISGDKTQDTWGGVAVADFWIVKVDTSGNKQWDRRYGGTATESMGGVCQTSDGGYLLGGSSYSGISGDKTQAAWSSGFNDFWVVRINASGTVLWDARFGGTGAEDLYAVQQTGDGGFILAGNSSSDISGDKTENTRGSYDYWLVKLDSNGAKQWDRRFGTSGSESVYDVRQATDGGYILAGTAPSSMGIDGDKSEPSWGLNDFWIVKIDASGNKLWDHRYGGTGTDQAFSVQQTTDGGYFIGGHSNSGISGDKTEASRGGWDYWVVKLDASGNKEWDRTLGGSGTENISNAIQTGDGCYLAGGYSDSGISGERTETSQGGNDYWIIRLGCVVLPVDIVAVTAENTGRGILVSWTVMNQENVHRYVVERKSLPDEPFVQAGAVEAGANSAGPIRYDFSDDPDPTESYSSGSKVYYRIRIEDYNGNHVFSKTVSVFVSGHGRLEAGRIYYDPDKQAIAFGCTFPASGSDLLSVELYDMTGQRMGGKQYPTNSGSVRDRLPVAHPGIYYLQISGRSGEEMVRKVAVH